MATCDGNTNLSDEQVEKLAESIVATKMETIALKYMKIQSETVANLEITYRWNAVALNRSRLNLWKCMNPGGNQVQVNFGKTC